MIDKEIERGETLSPGFGKSFSLIKFSDFKVDYQKSRRLKE
jgi:hypothetical protein